MSYTIEEINSYTKKLSFELNASELQPQVTLELKQKQQSVQLKGFRKGKVPLAMIQQLYGPEVEQAALHYLINRELDAVINREEIPSLIGPPSINNLHHHRDQETPTVHFEAIVEHVPKIGLKDFSRLTFTRDSVEVSAQEVEQGCQKLLQDLAVLEEVSGVALEQGHFAVINFSGEKADGQRPESMKGEEFMLELGSETLIPGFEPALLGMRVGESRKIPLAIPHGRFEQDLWGCQIVFSVELLEIKQKKYPELTDSVAKKLDYASKANMLAEVTAQLQQVKSNRANEKLRLEIIRKLVEENEIEIPAKLIEQHMAGMTKNMDGNLGDNLVELYQEIQRTDAPGMEFSVREKILSIAERAVFEVHSWILTMQIIKENKISVAESDIQKELAKMAKSASLAAPDIQALERNEAFLNQINYRILEGKMFDKIMGQMSITQL